MPDEYRATIEVAGGFDDPRKCDEFMRVVRMEIGPEGPSAFALAITLAPGDAKALAAKLEHYADFRA
jgi:hypothetical protein